MCGPPKRICQLSIDQTYAFDKAVQDARAIYSDRMHNIVMDNCHSFVAHVLNTVRYAGKDDWNQLSICWMVWRRGKWMPGAHIFLVVWTAVVVALVLLAVLVPIFT